MKAADHRPIWVSKPLGRRAILKAGAAAVLGAASGLGGPTTSAPAARRLRSGNPAARPDLADAALRNHIEVIQLTSEPDVSFCHIYMEAQVFTPDSRRFVLQRSGHAHGSDRNDPEHQFVLCDFEQRFALSPLTDEPGCRGPAVSPDGQYLYYFVDQSGTRKGGRLILKRVRLDGRDRRTVTVIDAPLPGTAASPYRLYPLSTISSDGRRLATSACVSAKDAPGPAVFAILVFDLQQGTVAAIAQGPTWGNTHPQYCRSTDPAQAHDLLVQENHSRQTTGRGDPVKVTDTAGTDIHVLRDDGSNLRSLPWGRDGDEFCQGHQCWRGRSDWAITSTELRSRREAQLIESRPVVTAEHLGRRTPGGVRNELSRGVPHPDFHHFATDLTGTKLITDAEPFQPQTGRIELAKLGRPGEDPLTDWTCLVRPRASGRKEAHLHPFLSPDGAMAFFNSDESGRLQAYMIRGLPV